jgi:hypothetical protein
MNWLLIAFNWVINFLAGPSLPAPMPTPQPEPQPIPPTPPPKYLWDTPANARHSLRVICDEEGLTVALKNDFSRTINCESGYHIGAVHPNVVNGKVVSTDYGICQINDHYHIGAGKDFPSVEYVMNNPEACVRWAARMAKAGKLDLWVCHSSGLCKSYSA